MNFDDYIEFVKEKHGEQKRLQGTPYYLHPVMVAKILKDKGFSIDYQIAGLFHDLIEDTDVTYQDILKISNREIADTVKLVTKEQGYNMENYIKRIKENDMAKMVKIADRIHNLSESFSASKEFRKKYVAETEKWFIDLANGTKFEEDLKKVLEELKRTLY